ncbi:hypothetical protein D9758_001437 [Tetrapyrgos nigripes]|uniref:Carboxylesterase type B domain-containing protein n=1 Tax=Tetrapyrgos nigripes TaxID=182062 RepID=A0A8H5GY39_9AGAR|nr:hypothetical protein D9758_001437 [Tetrapyrgos nigripes]
MLACLRNLLLETLLDITIQQHDSTSSQNDGDVYLPTVDGDFLLSVSSELTCQGRFVRMPVIIGGRCNPFYASEYNYGGVFTHQITIENLLGLYPIEDFNPNTKANLSAEFYHTAQVFWDILLACPSFLFGHAMVDEFTEDDSYEAPDGSVLVPPVFLYSFNQTIFTPSLESLGLAGLGVIHTSELVYIYANFTLYNTTGVIHPTSSDFTLLNQVSRSWSSFATTGRPTIRGKDTLQEWKGSYQPGAEMMDVSVYVVGGSDLGMSTSTEFDSHDRSIIIATFIFVKFHKINPLR